MVSRCLRTVQSANLISGGGIGGLTLAAVLHKFTKDVQIDMYETHSEFSEIGAGITVWQRTWYILQVLGLTEAVSKVVTPPQPMPSECGTLNYFLTKLLTS